MIIEVGSQSLRLLPAKAVLLRDLTLVVADLHLGKATAFQARGLPVPEGHSASDLERLSRLCREHSAERVVINGDLFHSRGGFTQEISVLLEQWMEGLGIPVELVVGNHDAKIKSLPRSLTVVSTATYGGFLIVHDPEDAPSACPSIAAHWHPVARIGIGRQPSLKMPCYLLREQMLVLPSFGEFTGGSFIKAQTNDRCFVAPAGKVIEVPVELLR
jgi:DNA ligase-associated metallophosphoesterase